MGFENFNLNPGVMSGVRALGYTIPTPIQLKSIPPIMDGRDVIALAQTGTGKTAAFMLPIMHRLSHNQRGHVRALIISPTRELVEQTYQVISGLGKGVNLRGLAIYGGVNMDQQIRALRKGIEIVVERHPSERHLRNEVDPRQSLFFDGPDPERGIISKLWVFTHNLARAGVMPVTAVRDLVKIIQSEMGSPKNQV